MVLAALLLAAAAQAAATDRGAPAPVDLKIEGDPVPVEDRGPRRAPTGERASGTVLFFHAAKGYGFIARDDGQRDVFVHISAVERAGIALNAGDRVEFELATDQRGKASAVNLVPIR